MINKYIEIMASAVFELNGMRIKCAVVDDEGENFGFVLVNDGTGDEKIVWVLSDPEGNSAGFLDICEIDRNG